MLSKFAALCPIILLIGMTLDAQPESSPVPHEIWKDAVDELRSHESITYDVDYRVKFVDERDTHSVSGTCTQIRKADDTVAGGIVWLSHGSVERYYDLGHVFVHNHDNRTTTVYERHESDQAGISRGRIADLLHADFLNPVNLERAINVAGNVTLKNDRIDDVACWKFTLKFSTPQDTNTSVLVVWIDAATSTVRKKQYVIQLDGQTQFTEWTFSHLRFDQASGSELEERNQEYLSQYEVAEFEQSSGTDRAAALLSYREVAPDISGARVTDAGLQSVRLSDMEASVYILDFWHIDCFTCRSAMSTYDEIYQQYVDSGLVVVGMNSSDGKESITEVRTFLNDRSIRYPTLLVDGEVDTLFGVTFHPTLYVLDRDRRVMFAQIGFREDRARLIDVIDNILRSRGSER